jgi:endonuclease YncB( thermonuclease family)
MNQRILVRFHLALWLSLCGVTAPASAATIDEVIGAKSGKVYHLYLQECPTAKRIRPENVVRYSSPEEAELAGRKLCSACQKIRAQRLFESAQAEKDKRDAPRGGPVTKARPPAASAPDDQPRRGGETALPHLAAVLSVLSGGTIELDVGEKVCLLGVVCPSEDQPFAREAVRLIEHQTRGRKVQLSQDPAAGPEDRRDALGRLRVYLNAEPDGRDLGGELLFQGYAWLDRQLRFDRQAEYARREEEAWRAKHGIWKPLDGEAGRREVVTGRFAQHYHDPHCPHVAHLAGKISMTINEAKSRRLPPCPWYGISVKPQAGKRSAPDSPK